MSNAAKYRLIRYVSYALELLAVFVIQDTPGLIPGIFGARPVVLVPATLSIAMFESEGVSMAFGLYGGLLIDFGMGGAMGFHALLLCCICYMVSLFTANLFQTNFLTALMISALSGAAILLLQWVFYFLLSGYQYPVYALTAHYLPIFCYTTVLVPVTYYFNRALALQIRSKEE